MQVFAAHVLKRSIRYKDNFNAPSKSDILNNNKMDANSKLKKKEQYELLAALCLCLCLLGSINAILH
jgi:hypothetical protein